VELIKNIQFKLLKKDITAIITERIKSPL